MEQLSSKSVNPVTAEDIHLIHIVDKNNFPALDGVTSYHVEIWEDCMRLPHWHPNASELGYVAKGCVEIFIWRSSGETAVFTVSAGMCYFIPQAALHSLNNIGTERAELMIGFSDDNPQDIDLPVAFNGLPLPIRDAYTSPHQELLSWQGSINNPLCGSLPKRASPPLRSTSPYAFDLKTTTPLFSSEDSGAVMWGVKNNWNILEGISILRACLKPKVARDAIWYPDAGTLYIVVRGKAKFHLIIKDHEPQPIEISYLDYVFVPCGVLHTFINHSDEDFEVIAFFSQANPLPEVSLAVSTAFFPNRIRKDTLTKYAHADSSNNEDPLKTLNFTTALPYLIKVNDELN